MFEIIPVLEVESACNWCEPQQAYEASVWWGEVLLVFFTTDEKRLAPDALNEAACEVLRQLTMALEPDSDTIIEPDALAKQIGYANCNSILCHWADFRPAVALVYRNKVVIPVENPAAPEGSERG